MGQLSGVRAMRLFGTLLHKPGMWSGSAIQNATSDWEKEGMELKLCEPLTAIIILYTALRRGKAWLLVFHSCSAYNQGVEESS